VNVATAVFADGRAYLLVLHVPLLNFGSSPENTITAAPVPVAPANLPVLSALSTVKRTALVSAYRQVLADFRPPVLAPALDALLRGRQELADGYSATCLNRVWRSTHFSWWMTTMLHRTPGADEMEFELQLAQLRYVASSRAAATSLAENYTGYPPFTSPGPTSPDPTKRAP